MTQLPLSLETMLWLVLAVWLLGALAPSLATMLWLVLAVWLFGALAFVLDIPGNVVCAGLILGTAAAVAEWSVMQDQRDRDR